jgi:hypothetical protein
MRAPDGGALLAHVAAGRILERGGSGTAAAHGARRLAPRGRVLA